MFMSFLQRYADTGSYAKYDFKTRTRTQFPLRRAFAMTYHKSQGLLIKFNSFDYTNDASVLAFQLNCFLRVVVFCCSIISFVRFYNIFSEVDDPHVQTLQKVIFLLDFNFVFVNQFESTPSYYLLATHTSYKNICFFTWYIVCWTVSSNSVRQYRYI